MRQENWEILGIESTDDPKLIRQAYAQKLKNNHPEEQLQGFLRLRQAYEETIEFVRGAANSHEPISHQKDVSDSHTNRIVILPHCPAAEEVFRDFWDLHQQEQDQKAIQVLADWWFNPELPPEWRFRFNRLFLDAVLEKGMKPARLAHIVWAIYWQGYTFNFQVYATSQQHSTFSARIKQAIESSLWDIRAQFSHALFGEEPENAFRELEALWLSPEFDHLGKRKMLRLIFLRYAATHPYLSASDLKKLDQIFQFRHAIASYQAEDITHYQSFEKRMRQPIPPIEKKTLVAKPAKRLVVYRIFQGILLGFILVGMLFALAGMFFSG